MNNEDFRPLAALGVTIERPWTKTHTPLWSMQFYDKLNQLIDWRCAKQPPKQRLEGRMKVSSGLCNRRVLWVAFGAVIAMSIAAVGSYYGFIVRDNDSDTHGLPQYAVGAGNIIHTQAYVGQPDDFGPQLARSHIVVEGVIDELYPARWTTPQPAGPGVITKEVAKNPNIHIRTPVQLSVKRVFKGESVGDTLKFSFVGGRVGDTALVYEGNETFEEGSRVIVFLGKGKPGSPAHNVEPEALYPRLHLVVRGDVAQGPIKDIPMKELLQQLNSNRQRSRNSQAASAIEAA